jgi:hypothetical protein
MMDITLLVISLLSLIVAATMSLMAWRVLRNERLRSSARVAALAAEIREGSGASPIAGEMFRSTAQRSRLPVMATAAAIVVVLAGAGTMLFGGGANNLFGGGTNNPEDSEAGPLTSRPLAVAPLELIALGHERDSDGLTVRGVLRNPSSGSDLRNLTAVVMLFDRDGGYAASGHAAVQTPRLHPGGETTFVVTISGAAGVERYRVSFRTERDIVPHVDMRS